MSYIQNVVRSLKKAGFLKIYCHPSRLIKMDQINCDSGLILLVSGIVVRFMGNMDVKLKQLALISNAFLGRGCISVFRGRPYTPRSMAYMVGHGFQQGAVLALINHSNHGHFTGHVAYTWTPFTY